MTNELEVTSLETSKKLVGLGLNHKAEYCWCSWNEQVFVQRSDAEAAPGEKFLSYAFTFSELGFLFKAQISKAFELCADYEHTVWQDKEIEARAEIIIRGIESGLLTV